MSENSKQVTERSDVRKAKGAAQEAIGKLIGDDAEIRKGRTRQQEGGADRPSRKSTEQE